LALRSRLSLSRSGIVDNVRAYDISIGVRHDSPALVAAIDAVLENAQPAIAAILAAYAVPMVPGVPD
jgi:hypothetical protein